jgi:hypothetical protein
VKAQEEERETPQAVGSSGVARRLVTGKRSDRRSGGRCEPLIKCLKLSAFRQPGVQGSTVWDSRPVEPRKDRSRQIFEGLEPLICSEGRFHDFGDREEEWTAP